MSYACSDASVKSGDILIWSDSFKGASRYGAIIRACTASEYTHAGIALNIDGQLYVAEANIPVVRVVKVSSYNRVYYLQTPNCYSAEGRDFIYSKLGLKYSYVDAICSLFGFTLSDENRWQCAEFVVEYLKVFGHDLGSAYTPSKLVRAAMEQFNSPLIRLNG